MINCYYNMNDVVDWPMPSDYIDAGYCIDRFTLKFG